MDPNKGLPEEEAAGAILKGATAFRPSSGPHLGAVPSGPFRLEGSLVGRSLLRLRDL